MARSISSRHAVPDARLAGISGRSRALSLLLSLRPEQWTKNLLVFAALIFAQRLFDWAAVRTAALAFAIFCALSSVVYLINDVADRETDRQHPLKSRRPIAAGAVSVFAALTTATAIGTAAIGTAFLLSTPFGLVAVSYLALMALYSGPLKQMVI